MADQTKTHSFKQVMASCRPVIGSVAGFSFVINALILAVPLFMIQLFDRVLNSQSVDTLYVLTSAVVAALIIAALLDLVRSRILVRMAGWFEKSLTASLFDHGLTTGGFTKNFRDLSQVRAILSGSGLIAVLDVPWAPLFILAIYILHPVLGMIAIAGAAVLVALAFANEFITKRALGKLSEKAGMRQAVADAITRQGDALQSMGMVEGVRRWWDVQSTTTAGTQRSISDTGGLFLAISKFVRLVLQVLILALAANLVIQSQLSIGAMIAASILFARAMAPVEQAIGVWRHLVAALAAYQRIKQSIHDYKAAEAMPFLHPAAQLDVKDLTFAPPAREAAIFEQVNFTIEPGQFVAITGPSGAGKTSLLRMIVGVLNPDHGCVRLDGADVSKWSAEDRGQYIGYVPQHVEFLPGTIAQNIARFQDASPEEIYQAAAAADLHDAILHLPDGYETVIGGPSDILSGGMRQRVALARALFGKPELLVLDEPYSNLDSDGIASLLAAVESVTERQGSVIMVTHRPSIYVRADQVFELKDQKCLPLDTQPKQEFRLFDGRKNQKQLPDLGVVTEAKFRKMKVG